MKNKKILLLTLLALTSSVVFAQNQTEISSTPLENPQTDTTAQVQSLKKKVKSEKRNAINSNKIFSVKSSIYKDISALFISQKKALPSSTGPWNADEMLKMLALLSYEDLEPSMQTLYNNVKKELQGQPNINLQENLQMNVGMKINAELYAHTNDAFCYESDWYTGYEERENFFEADWEIWAMDWLYTFTQATIRENSGIGWSADYDNHYNNYVCTNILFIPPNSINDFSESCPTRAFFSIGKEHWNFSGGRDVIQWGAGETGNLFMGGNALYDDYLRFATYFDKFKYTFVTNFYPHESNTTSLISGTKALIAHKAEFRAFDQRLSVAASESIMYQSANNTLDISILNPENIFHNYYARLNANSMLGLDADFAICKYLNFYSQFVLDDFAVFGEGNPLKGTGGGPNAMGFLAGFKSIIPTENGYFKASVEGVYNDSYLYLRESYDSVNQSYGVSFYRKVREYWCNDASIHYYDVCTGYKYGGDAIVADLKASYHSLNKWNCEGEFFYMAHGIIYSDTQWAIYPVGVTAPTTPSTFSPVGKNPSTGEVEHTFRFSLSGDYEFLKGFSAYARSDLYWVINKDNAKLPCQFDAQFTVGLEYKLGL